VKPETSAKSTLTCLRSPEALPVLQDPRRRDARGCTTRRLEPRGRRAGRRDTGGERAPTRAAEFPSRRTLAPHAGPPRRSRAALLAEPHAGSVLGRHAGAPHPGYSTERAARPGTVRRWPGWCACGVWGPSRGGSVMNYVRGGVGQAAEGCPTSRPRAWPSTGGQRLRSSTAGDPVIVFDRDGTFFVCGGEGIFRRPHGITIGPDDTLWLTDDLHHDPPVHRRGEPAADRSVTPHPVHAPGRPAVQPADPRGLCSKRRRRLRGDGYGTRRAK